MHGLGFSGVDADRLKHLNRFSGFFDREQQQTTKV
jgi:hypothetical protein